jgi:hypothetical protein
LFPQAIPLALQRSLLKQTHTVLNHKKKLPKADARAAVNIVQRKVEVITRVPENPGAAPKKEEEALPSKGVGIVDLAHNVGAATEFIEKGEVTEVLRTEFDAAKDDMEHDGAPEEGVHDLPDGGSITNPVQGSHKVGKPVSICGDADMTCALLCNLVTIHL